MKLALRIGAGTLHGTRDGVPRLANALPRHGANATFLFTVGPDRSGRAIFNSRLRREADARHANGMLYGTMLLGPSIGLRCRKIARRVRDDGFETGVQGWDAFEWRRRVLEGGDEWTTRQMQLAWGRYSELFGELPRMHGAVGWQMNRHAYRLEQRTGLDYASDTRGHFPFLPVHEGELIACPQLPTTLPTLDELMRQGMTADTAVAALLERSREPLPTGHVYSAQAEREGLPLLPHFERLLEGWQALGYELTSLRTLYESLDRSRLPHCLLDYGTVPGRSGVVALQGKAYLDGATEEVVLPDRRRHPRPQNGYVLPRRVDEPYRPRPVASLPESRNNPG